jgi:hypothetical protein
LTSLLSTPIMAATLFSSRVHSGSLGQFTIAVLLIVCSGFTIGLTFAPCYSSICVENWFLSQTRTHIAVFYGGIGIAATYFAGWSRSTVIRSFSDLYLFDKPLPLIGIRLTLGGTLLSAWISAFTLATTAFWLPAEARILVCQRIRGGLDAVHVPCHMGWCDRLLVRHDNRTGFLTCRKEQSHL